MIHYTCDLCGCVLLEDDDVRYRVRIEVYAAYDAMEVTAEDLDEDHEEKIDALCRQISEMEEDELTDSVYKEIEFDLCPPCQKRYIKDPLFKKRPRIRFNDSEN